MGALTLMMGYHISSFRCEKAGLSLAGQKRKVMYNRGEAYKTVRS